MLLISTGRCKGTTRSHASIHRDERRHLLWSGALGAPRLEQSRKDSLKILKGRRRPTGLADAGAGTIEAGLTALEQQSTSPWLIRFRSRNTEQVHLRLFCFYYAGASASI